MDRIDLRNLSDCVSDGIAAVLSCWRTEATAPNQAGRKLALEASSVSLEMLDEVTFESRGRAQAHRVRLWRLIRVASALTRWTIRPPVAPAFDAAHLGMEGARQRVLQGQPHQEVDPARMSYQRYDNLLVRVGLGKLQLRRRLLSSKPRPSSATSYRHFMATTSAP